MMTASTWDYTFRHKVTNTILVLLGLATVRPTAAGLLPVRVKQRNLAWTTPDKLQEDLDRLSTNAGGKSERILTMIFGNDEGWRDQLQGLWEDDGDDNHGNGGEDYD